MKKATELVKQVEELARTVESWADLANALYAPFTGLLTRAYPTREERAEFMKTEEYKKIGAILSFSIQKHGLVDGATPTKKSGRFVVRLPRSLHAALEEEADREGVSLNQLVVAKLAVQLSTATGQT